MRNWFVAFGVVGVTALLWGTYRVTQPVPAGKIQQTTHTVKVGWKTTSKTANFISQGEYAVGAPNLGGVFLKSQDQNSVPIASLTKMMTALLVIQAYPLGPNESGPQLHFNQADVTLLQRDIANGDSVVTIKDGETMTERQALEALLIPSGDNIATKLAEWVGGSVPNFVKEMNSTARKFGMTSTHYADTSGVDPKTVSDARDQWIIASKFMAVPVLREIAAKKTAKVPVAGTIYNYNALLGKDGIFGIKTGNTSQAGGNLASAKEATAGKQKTLLIGIVLGQQSVPPLARAFAVTPKLLSLGAANLRAKKIVRKGEHVGSIVFPWGLQIPLVTEGGLTTAVFPGEGISQTLHINASPHNIKNGEVVGYMAVRADKKVYKVQVQAASDYRPPNLLWRLANR